MNIFFSRYYYDIKKNRSFFHSNNIIFLIPFNKKNRKIEKINIFVKEYENIYKKRILIENIFSILKIKSE